MFKKVLIANRGAIANRIERTLQKMGIASVAVYTKVDQDSLHVKNADEAVCIGEDVVKDSYLNADLILQTAKQLGVEAIHPGYGFLSENADFARACEREGIVFIGPTPKQLETFGLKHQARAIAEQVNVPMLPGTDLMTSEQGAKQAAAEIGYPVMLKSTAGGGGIGMRICYNDQQLSDAFQSVCRLAEANFSNGGVFLEKYIERARHIEVQIFGNQSGEVVALGERDCSIQRRNQKVVEESPAPLLSQFVREQMYAAAIALGKAVNYRSAGTVEFLYDTASEQFYFLEVNTRLQVEHGVTEEVLGIDLVEWMIKEAAGELQLESYKPVVNGHSIQVRVYAEDCANDFRPSGGKIDAVQFAGDARVETWIANGVEVTPFYDPMLAKLIVHGATRKEALEKIDAVLTFTRIYGVTTNLQYLQNLLQQTEVREGHVFTQLLKDFDATEHAIEVIDGGVQTTVQDWPGRSGYWDVGVPPCGPMDMLAFRLGNKIVQNDDDAAGLEFTLKGGKYRFRAEMTICLTGADMEATIDGIVVNRYEAIRVMRGQELHLKEAKAGMRAYLLVQGGLDMPRYLNSSATFTLGAFGGHGGRALRTGDILRVHAVDREVAVYNGFVSEYTNEWSIGVIAGPHCTEEFLDASYLEELTTTKWEVHFNSSRTGVRLIGPTPKWSREDGGEAGLHPSNIHDNAYAIGTIDLTGDMPIILGPDGPSLGGFVCPVTTATAELWKIGQLHPGDKVSFQLLSLEQAEQLLQQQEAFIAALQPMISLPQPQQIVAEDAILLTIQKDDYPVVVRAAGDRYVLIEFGEMELDLLLRFKVHALMEALQQSNLPIIELTPGIRSLQVHFDILQITSKQLVQQIAAVYEQLPPLENVEVPSRIVRLPLSWDDPSTQVAIDRYQQNVRPDAPWCPSNIEFIRRINGLQSIEDVKEIVFNANYLVMGLGDVYLGAPVATPLDPRHRLVTTKYNPARTWTPENAVGIGGAYMCIYGMEGPGGYQFVGRTIQVWNQLQQSPSFQDGKPWLLRFFDQIQFYPVTAQQLEQMREDFPRGKFEIEIEETTFKLADYMAFLNEIEESANQFKAQQQAAFQAERLSWKEQGLAEYIAEAEVKPLVQQALPENSEAVYCTMPGSVWKVLVQEGEYVQQGDVLVIEESMKMEFPQFAPFTGRVTSIYVEPGQEVQAGQLIVALTAEEVLVHAGDNVR
ncbi:MAG: urea carboxylase [Lysinibacillus sp.]